MFLNRAAISGQHTIEVSVESSSPQNYCDSGKSSHAAGLRFALTFTATMLQWIVPVVWVVMPEKASLITRNVP